MSNFEYYTIVIYLSMGVISFVSHIIGNRREEFDTTVGDILWFTLLSFAPVINILSFIFCMIELYATYSPKVLNFVVLGKKNDN